MASANIGTIRQSPSRLREGSGVGLEYDANCYAAFVRDPDGSKVEAVTFQSG